MEIFVPVEKMLKMTYLEQYAQHIINYSSRYNSSNSYSYAPINLVGKYAKYPSYGDFPEAYFLRSYGFWWKESNARLEDYRTQDFDLLGAEDFVTLEFGSVVIPRDICIYEIYNPGAIIRIWGCIKGEKRWYLLWEGFPQKCMPRSRKFCPPLRKINCLIDVVRLEFNQSHLEYHTSIDAVLLGGYQPDTELQYCMIKKGLVEIKNEKTIKCHTVSDIEHKNCNIKPLKIDYFSNLPHEIVLHIFHYLDLKSLSRCAQVNRKWNQISGDQSLYQNISFKIYWYLVDDGTLKHFTDTCTNIRKLDLSWCNTNQLFHHKLNHEYQKSLKRLLSKNQTTLSHLNLNDNYFVDNELMYTISECSELIDLRLHHTHRWSTAPLEDLHKLVTLDLSLTQIHDSDLIKIIKANPNLENLILDLCEHLVQLDHVIEVVVKYAKNLKTWSSWKTVSFTSEGLKNFQYLSNLEELDLGWCLISSDPGNCLLEIASGCKKLRRLVLSEWRGASDQLIMPVILSCKELSQLDLLGIKNITSELCEKILLLLPKLRLLDISFCDTVRHDEVQIWRQQYPHITIQRSCQFVVTDYLT
ncbi:F-box/LRR-repeat protein 4 [Cylas formicarius]|uniref:F-box/LRR-repeat protein 4 n=1 Tax=Cylas formicarius TaxID=197179 RepID=UPI002958D731|nr:F-box/LRR-repeat protein 4 [Cylas formicarius]